MGTIAIIGPGAMGCLFGGCLARAGHRVWLVDHRPERAARLRSSGLTVDRDGDTCRVVVEATTDPQAVPAPELVMVCVKAYATAGIAPVAAALAGKVGTVLTLQNGIGNLDALATHVSPSHLLGGVTSQGATLLGTGHVRHAGIGPTAIGAWAQGATGRVERVAALLSEAGIGAVVTGDLGSTLWHKLVTNAAINPLGALLRVPNGELVEHRQPRLVMQAVIAEAVAVANAQGIGLSAERMTALAEQVCRDTAANLNSMLQDVLHHRRTEIEAINGAIAVMGKRLGMQTPVNDLLAGLVSALEQTYHRQVDCRSC